MTFDKVEVENVINIETTNWDSQVIIRASLNKKVYKYYYVSLIGGGWRVLSRKPNGNATTQQIQKEGLELQNHSAVKLLFLNNDFKETPIKKGAV